MDIDVVRSLRAPLPVTVMLAGRLLGELHFPYQGCPSRLLLPLEMDGTFLSAVPPNAGLMAAQFHATDGDIVVRWIQHTFPDAWTPPAFLPNAATDTEQMMQAMRMMELPGALRIGGHRPGGIGPVDGPGSMFGPKAQEYTVVSLFDLEQRLEAFGTDIDVRSPQAKLHPTPLLPGRNPKLAFRRLLDGTFIEPTLASPSTHVVKGYAEPFGAGVELYLLEFARRLDFPVVEAGLLELQGKDYLVTRRFDRMEQDGRVYPVHCETMPQTLNRLPGLRDEEQGLPSLREMVCHVLQQSRDPVWNQTELLMAVLLTAVVADPGASARRFSIRHGVEEDGQPGFELAPLCGLETSLLSPEPQNRHPLSVGGHRNLMDRDITTWGPLIQDAGLNLRDTRDHLVALLRGIPSAAAETAEMLAPTDRFRVVRELSDRISERAKALERRFLPRAGR